MKNKPVILVVDDQPKNIELLEAFLVPLGYSIAKAAGGEEALKIISADQIDLVLLDVMMPGMDGFEVTRKVRLDTARRQLPIILVTSLKETEDRVKGIDAGCDDFISKPVDRIELLARVRSLLKVKAYNDLLSNYRKELETEVAKRTEELQKLTVELRKSNAAMRRFVPEQLLKLLGRSTIEEVKLGDHTAINMVVMFADIREFSTLSEKLTPEQTFAFINQYLAELGPLVRKYGGFIDKYIGDGIMALFPGAPEDALRCTIEMQRRLIDFNDQREKTGAPPVKIGIGLHEGRLMLGTIGEVERMDGTVISDTVNTASRIEGTSKQFGIGVAVSERILLGLKDKSAYHIRFIGRVAVKGRREELSIFEIYDGDPEPVKKKKDSIKAAFERGLNAFYGQKYGEASKAFEAVIAELPGDEASFHYIRIMRKINMS